MIVDQCKPLNRGEGPTVRIVMTVPEAVSLRDEIADVAGRTKLSAPLQALLRALGALPLATSTPAVVEPDHECG